MKFGKATLTLLFLASRASAWTSTLAAVSRTATHNNHHHHHWLPLLAVRSGQYKQNQKQQQQQLQQLHSTSPAVNEVVTTDQVGEAQTESFRLLFQRGGEDEKTVVSPWHDIPLMNEDGTYNMVVEIPKMTKAKMEVATKEINNPIAQDIKKGKLRDYHGPIFWNYGCLPQTWEDPNTKHPELDCFGDNDPIDVVEIGSSALPMGSIKPIKPLGVLAMIDDGELDWKVLAISVDDPLASVYNDIDDVPDSIQSGIREWFRWYKTPDDKPLNEFGFNEKYLNKESAITIIEETNDAWKKLKAGSTDSGKLWIGKE